MRPFFMQTRRIFAAFLVGSVNHLKTWATTFYASKAWHDTRDAYLSSVGGICERCDARGEISAAKIVHHKTYLTRENINNPAISLAWRLLEALCQDCHNKEHHRGETVERYTFDGEGNVIPA